MGSGSYKINRVFSASSSSAAAAAAAAAASCSSSSRHILQDVGIASLLPEYQ